MHEAGMVDRILEVVLARAAEAGAGRITRIRLEAGPLSGVADDALRFHWAEHAAGTIAEGAELVVSPTDDLIELRLVSFDAEDAPADKNTAAGASSDPGPDDAADADGAAPGGDMHRAGGDPADEAAARDTAGPAAAGTDSAS